MVLKHSFLFAEQSLKDLIFYILQICLVKLPSHSQCTRGQYEHTRFNSIRRYARLGESTRGHRDPSGRSRDSRTEAVIISEVKGSGGCNLRVV